MLSEKIPDTRYRDVGTSLGIPANTMSHIKHNVSEYPEITFFTLVRWIEESRKHDELEPKLIGMLDRLGLMQEEILQTGR